MQYTLERKRGLKLKSGKNIIQLYFEVGKETPFYVRRENWAPNRFLTITKVKPRKTNNGWFGDVLGYHNELDGDFTEYWGSKENPVDPSCSGCYQWELLDKSSLISAGLLVE